MLLLVGLSRNGDVTMIPGAGPATVVPQRDTMPDGIYAYYEQFRDAGRVAWSDAESGADVHTTAALGVLYVLPVLVLFLALRRLMVSEMVSSIQNL